MSRFGRGEGDALKKGLKPGKHFLNVIRNTGSSKAGGLGKSVYRPGGLAVWGNGERIGLRKDRLELYVVNYFGVIPTSEKKQKGAHACKGKKGRSQHVQPRNTNRVVGTRKVRQKGRRAGDKGRVGRQCEWIFDGERRETKRSL